MTHLRLLLNRVVLILGVRMKYLRLMIRLGFHGISHTKKIALDIEWMHNNGIGG